MSPGAPVNDEEPPVFAGFACMLGRKIRGDWQMVLTPSERKRLKDAGYVYHRKTCQWMLPEDIHDLETRQKDAEQMSALLMGIPVVGILIWLFLLAVGGIDNPYR
jgi:hypothetical protein